MPKTLYIADEANNGNYKAVIYEEGYRGTGQNDLYSNPMGSNNAAYLFFHSDLSFFRSPSSLTASITLPTITRGQDCSKKKNECVTIPASGSNTYLLQSGDYSNKVLVPIDANSSRSLSGSLFIQQPGAQSFRIVTIYSNTSGIYAREEFFAYDNDIPEISVLIKIYVVLLETENRTAATEKVYINPTNFRINSGLFNSDLNYVDVDTSNSSGVAFPNGPTLLVQTNVSGFSSSSGFSYSFNGTTGAYGSITGYPSNTVYKLNLI